MAPTVKTDSSGDSQIWSVFCHNWQHGWLEDTTKNYTLNVTACSVFIYLWRLLIDSMEIASNLSTVCWFSDSMEITSNLSTVCGDSSATRWKLFTDWLSLVVCVKSTSNLARLRLGVCVCVETTQRLESNPAGNLNPFLRGCQLSEKLGRLCVCLFLYILLLAGMRGTEWTPFIDWTNSFLFYVLIFLLPVVTIQEP